MSLHIAAKPGEIAPFVLLPGDPLRAKFIAENFLEDARCYSEVRGMLGFTGTFQGVPVSVQGTGMGIPSFAIYGQELIDQYGVKAMVRIGSCGAFQTDIELRDIILAMSASTDSSFNDAYFKGKRYAPCANFGLLHTTYQLGVAQGLSLHVGNVLTSDRFYEDDPDWWKLWAAYGVMGVDMETLALYSIAARAGIPALSILTVSDQLAKGGALTVEDRQNSFREMMNLALSLAVKHSA